jgi:hypothetical protein
MQFPSAAVQNPLTMFMRQPKIYTRLPSGGSFWPTGSIEIPETGQIAVYSMTAKDEMLLNVPDALMNGQAVVDVIQNCIPAVKNAWYAPSIDIDAMLIAIRIATYGEMMTTPITVSGDIELDYQIDLRIVLDSTLRTVTWHTAVPITEDLTVFVKPLNYKQLTEAALQSFETQKIVQLTSNDQLSQDDKVRMFKESFAKLTNSTVGVVTNSISHIDSVNGSTDNPDHIKEFMNNIDKEMFNKIQSHLEQLREVNSVKPMRIEVTDELRAQGVTGDFIEVPLVFDASTFFV